METSAIPQPDVSAFGLSFDGRTWHYRQYSYDRFADALDYAQLDRARPGLREESAPQDWQHWCGPTSQDQLQMAAHGIVYERGRYSYGPYRYDLLATALEYARREPGLPAGGQAATQARQQ